MNGDVQSVIRGYLERAQVAKTMSDAGRWNEAGDLLRQLMTDVKSCKISASNRDEHDARNTFLRALEANLKLVQQNVRDEDDLHEAMTRQSGSPEPPADPDVWSKPSPPLPSSSKFGATKKGVGAAGPRPREISKSTSSMSTNPADVKPANPTQGILPQNSAGDSFDASAYDAYIVQAVRGTMATNTENTMSLDDIIGMHDVKQVLHEAVTLPLLVPEFFQGLRSPWKAMVLAGPPGTGKTLIARAIASESSSTFFTVSSTDLSSKWRGDSEKIVRLLFELARFYAPSIIFIDQIDTLGGQRGNSGEHEASRRVKSEFLVQMDGSQNKFDSRRVFVLAATNIPWELDEALRRRFEKRIFIPLPDIDARKKLIEKSMEGTPKSDEINYDDLAARTEGFSGADVVSLCRTAAINVLRRYDTKSLRGGELTAAMESLKAELVRNIDFEAALQAVSPSAGPDTMLKCKEWCDSFGAM
nr:Chain A, Meiotic spindle formation protein mei-1 [Caenorhabditis elegans]5WC0_B Chain B, Meiotic spindle formation protein mei-1 [Caenorhabditis elegans]5WC0_C Chain C, Meiotic spindle formation protein mei-1 [Caenorhabditis elegans]5WC0_D Chain D, Meiotic spindle formation protein mei-1 [Caenorhabditis elegans]5WC0_E Chain E, Meiotic spindle formation protein mei-1 [Caenorhabditis elegans]5WC0_F Chain F, Meiotic spindle formation protein mei-1 [Caenorhabditis elegans]5WC1_A Chain A, Meiot